MAMGSSTVRKGDVGGGGAAEDHHHHHLRALAARTVTDSLRAAVSMSSAAEKAARFEECARNLEAEKAKMEVFRRELPISVRLVADVIEWLKDEVAQHRRRPATELLAAAPSPSPVLPAKRKAEGVNTEADASDKRSWMSSAQLWTCGSHSSTSNSNGGSVKRQAQKVSNTFMPLNGLPTLTKSSEKLEAAAMSVPDLSLSSPAIDAPCPAAPSANSSAITDAGAQHQQSAQRKARRCWSPELHRRFVAALQRLGGPQAATPKQIREMMKVDGLTNDEVKSHLQKYRLHTRRASDGDQQAASGLCPPQEQYTTSQHSTSQSDSPQGPLQLTGSSQAMSVTAGDSDRRRQLRGRGGGRQVRELQLGDAAERHKSIIIILKNTQIICRNRRGVLHRSTLLSGLRLAFCIAIEGNGSSDVLEAQHVTGEQCPNFSPLRAVRPENGPDYLL